MKKLFISQQMRGRTNDEILTERRQAVQDVQRMIGEEVEPMNTFFTNYDGKPLEFLGKAISMMAQADMVYFCKGWEQARGCRIEHDAAVAYGLDILYERE